MVRWPDTSLMVFPTPPVKQMCCNKSGRLWLGSGHTPAIVRGPTCHWSPGGTQPHSEPLRVLLWVWGGLRSPCSAEKRDVPLRPKSFWGAPRGTLPLTLMTATWCLSSRRLHSPLTWGSICGPGKKNQLRDKVPFSTFISQCFHFRIIF